MVTMETSTVQTYEEGTNITTNEHFRLWQGDKYICSFSIQICGKGKYAPVISQNWTMYNLKN